MLAPVIATPFSQNNSSEFSPIMPDNRSETIPSSRISPDPSDSQLIGVSSLQFTSLIFCRVQVRGQGQPWQKLHLCSGPIFVLISMFVLDYCPYGRPWPIIKFLTEAVRFRFFICWCLIETMMPCIWTRCSGPPAEKQAHNIKDPAVYLIYIYITMGMGYFLSICTKPIWWVCYSFFFFLVSSDHRIQCHLKFQSCLITEYAGDCFWMKPSRTTCGDVGDVWYFFRFLTPRLN